MGISTSTLRCHVGMGKSFFAFSCTSLTRLFRSFSSLEGSVGLLLATVIVADGSCFGLSMGPGRVWLYIAWYGSGQSSIICSISDFGLLFESDCPVTKYVTFRAEGCYSGDLVDEIALRDLVLGSRLEILCPLTESLRDGERFFAVLMRRLLN